MCVSESKYVSVCAVHAEAKAKRPQMGQVGQKCFWVIEWRGLKFAPYTHLNMSNEHAYFSLPINQRLLFKTPPSCPLPSPPIHVIPGPLPFLLCGQPAGLYPSWEGGPKMWGHHLPPLRPRTAEESMAGLLLGQDGADQDPIFPAPAGPAHRAPGSHRWAGGLCQGQASCAETLAPSPC